MKNVIFKSRFVVFLVGLLTLCVTPVWGAEDDAHDFSQTLSQQLNDGASISSIEIPIQSYPIKEVKVTWSHNKNITNAVTIAVSVGSTSFGSADVTNGSSQVASFKTTPQSSVKGAITLSFTNNCGSGTGKGTFSVANVQLVEGADYTHDVLTNADFAATGTTYTDFSNVSKNTAVYAGNSAKNNGIQLRSTNPAGIVSTTSGGKIKTVTVTWNSNCTSGRTIDVYGSNTAYTSAADLYDNTNKGEKLGSIVMGTSTSITVTGDYAYVGVRSNSNSLNIDDIDFAWEEVPALPTYDDISSMYDAATSTPQTVNVNFNNWVVTGIRDVGEGGSRNQSVFVSDGTYGFIIFGSGGADLGFEVGDKLNGTVECTISRYQYGNTFDVSGIDSNTDGLTVTNDCVITPVNNPTISSLGGKNCCSVIRLDGWKYNSSTQKLSKGTEEIAVFDWLNSGVTLQDNHVYNINGAAYFEYGTGSPYTKEIMFRSSDDITDIMHNVSWMVNGVDYTEGTPSTSVAHGEQVTDLPTEPVVDCNGKSFVGWTASENYSHETTAPSDLFTDAVSSPAIGNNTTFYAVFADVAGGGWKPKSII